MILLFNSALNPARNLALEEYLLTGRDQDFFMIWRNRPCVIVGRNQNPLAQINHVYTRSRGIPVFRRISGGGAVYHDPGNVNFTLIRSMGSAIRIEYHDLLDTAVHFLRHLGIQARLDGQSDIVIDRGKISGSAQHIHKTRALHHATLLFDADLKSLSNALSGSTGFYKDHSVDSVRKKVTNLRPHLKTDMKVEDFMRRFMEFFHKENPDSVQTALSMAEQKMIQKLAGKKYESWEWNFRKSPNYRFETMLDSPGGQVEIQLEVRKGTIKKARLKGRHLTSGDILCLEKALTGTRHDFDHVLKAISAIGANPHISGFAPQSWATSLF